MAGDKDTSQERTQEPTQKKLQDSRKEGQVLRSRELNTSIMLLFSAMSLYLLGEYCTTRLLTIFKRIFTLSRDDLLGETAVLSIFQYSMIDGLLLLLPVFLLLVGACFVGPIGLGGWSFTTKSLSPKFSRMNPLKGFKRMFGLQGFVEFWKTVGKFLVLSSITVVLMRAMLDQYLGLSLLSPGRGVIQATEIIVFVFFVLSAGTFLIALVDVPYQKVTHMRKLRMTHQEIREESKESDGNPEMRRKVRQLQQETSNRQMLVSVKNADVVIVNPTHYSVALAYSSMEYDAPVVVALGKDHMALYIRMTAEEHNVPVFEAPPLARALYANVKLDECIPVELFEAVAKVLSYVFQLKKLSGKEALELERPIDLPIDESLLDSFIKGNNGDTAP